MGKKPKGFHNAFYDARERLAAVAPPPPKPGAPRPAAAPAPTEKPRREDELFADEMAGVRPLAADPRGRLNAPAPSPRPTIARRAEEDAEAYALLADLVTGEGPFDISATDEYVEGLAPGIDRRLLRKLKRGDYAVQAHLDLHGMTQPEARAAVERFVEEARTGGRRCVLVVHGRGHNSEDGIPVLKEAMKVWLQRGRLSRSVLAFATARPADGGAGALYLLVRR